MSLARIYTTKTVRKDWTCGKCGAAIKKGVDGRISFAVGFRGYEQTRCTRQECFPTRAERESSALASVYGAVDSADLSGAACRDDLIQIRDDVAAAVREVAEEYESNEMFEINEMLQERADMLNSAADELENWEPQEDEPVEDDEAYHEIECTDCDGSGQDEEGDACAECDGAGSKDAEEDFEEDHASWLEAATESLQGVIDEMELP